MRSRLKLFRAFGMLTLVAALAVLAAGCGGGGKKSSSGGNAGSSGKTYQQLKVIWDAPDYMDPALAYTVAAWQTNWYVYEGLLGYKHVSGSDGATLEPYLAESMPKISADGTKLSFKLRDGLKYSDGTAVKASDFAASIERLFKVDSPGVGFFGVIKGVSGPNGYATTKKGHISGIVTNDSARTIDITLDHPEGDILYILSTQFASILPANTPASDQSTKGIPSTGPYMIQNYVPSRSFILVRNPNYNDQIPTMPSGNPDKVTGKIITDPVAAYQQVVSNQSDYDFQVVPNDRLPEAQSKYKDRLKFYTSPNTYYYFLNNKLPPFNNLKARQAVEYAIDRNAIISGVYGGLGRPTQNFLPPDYPQYKKLSAWTFDIAKAKQLVQQSGTAGASVDVYGPNEDPSKASTEYLASQLVQDRLQAEAALAEPPGLLHDDRKPGDEGPGGLHRLVPGLPAPDRLVRRAAERRPDHADPQQQPRQCGRPVREQGDQRTEEDHRAHAAGRRPLGERRQGSDGHVRDHGPIHEPVPDRLLQHQAMDLSCYVVPCALTMGLRSQLPEVRGTSGEGADRRRSPSGSVSGR